MGQVKCTVEGCKVEFDLNDAPHYLFVGKNGWSNPKCPTHGGWALNADPRYEQEARDYDAGLPVRIVNDDGQHLARCSECGYFGEVFSGDGDTWSCIDFGACVERMKSK